MRTSSISRDGKKRLTFRISFRLDKEWIYGWLIDYYCFWQKWPEQFEKDLCFELLSYGDRDNSWNPEESLEETFWQDENKHRIKEVSKEALAIIERQYPTLD